MPTSGTSLSDQEIIARCKSGALVLDMNRSESDEANPSSLVSRCISLHNAGQIDLFGLIDTAQFATMGGSTFFALQHLFCKAIPQLDAPADQVMRAAKVLVEKGGNDFAANMPNAALRAWCAKDLGRAREIVGLADKGDALAVHSLTFALEALADTALARATATKYLDERRLSGISALGRIKSTTPHEAEASANLLLAYIGPGHDDQTRCNALGAVFSVCEPFSALSATHVPQAVAAASASASELVLFALARTVWLHPNMFDRRSLQAALDALTSIDATKAGIVHELDNGLNALLKTPNGDLALNFLATIISLEDSAFELEQFEAVKHELVNKGRNELFKLVVRWLLTGNHRLCESVTQLLRTGKETPFETSTQGLGLSSADYIFLAYKAIGYLFTNPVVAASILVASLRDCDKATAAKICGLLFDPLLVNYGGGVRDYLRTIKRGDAAYASVRRALKLANAYIEGLDINVPIKELRPSEYQRSVERIRTQDMMREAHKEAEKLSVLMSLVHRSTLLYGRKSMTFVLGPDNQRRPMTMDMHSFSTSFELPRMEIIDPVGLSYTLLMFRAAKRK